MSDDNESLKNCEIKDDAKESAREKILTSAASLFAVKGFEGVSIREIADASGVNLSMVSYYFGGKEGLYNTIIREHGLKLRDEFMALVNDYHQVDVTKESFLNFVTRFIKKIIYTHSRTEDIFKILETEKVYGYPRSGAVIQEVFIPIAETFNSVIIEAQDKGFVNKELNPHFVFVSILESVKGLLCHLDCRQKINPAPQIEMPETADDIKEQFLILFTKGLLK